MDTMTDNDTIPASRIMRERSHFQAEAERLRTALAGAEKTSDLWLDHYLEVSTERWALRDKVRELEKQADEAANREARLAARIAALVEWVENGLEHDGETPADPHVRELIEAAGVECPECEGRGWVADEEMIPHGGPSNGYSTRRVADECEECDGIGRCLR